MLAGKASGSSTLRSKSLSSSLVREYRFPCEPTEEGYLVCRTLETYPLDWLLGMCPVASPGVAQR